MTRALLSKALIIYALVFHSIFLSSCSRIAGALAETLISVDTLRHAPVIFVLGGNAYERANASYHEAKRLNIDTIIALGGDTVYDLLPFNITITYAQLTQFHIERLKKQNGDTLPIVIPVCRATSTWEEISLIKAIMDTLNIDTAIIISSLYHTQRIKWTISKIIPKGKVFYIGGAYPKRYDPYNWHLTEEGVMNFSISFLKSIYYFLKYGVFYASKDTHIQYVWSGETCQRAEPPQHNTLLKELSGRDS